MTVAKYSDIRNGLVSDAQLKERYEQFSVSDDGNRRVSNILKTLIDPKN